MIPTLVRIERHQGAHEDTGRPSSDHLRRARWTGEFSSAPGLIKGSGISLVGDARAE